MNVSPEPVPSLEEKPLSLDREAYRQAIKQWMISEIESGPTRAPEIGKFLFSVSGATIATLTALAKIYEVTLSHKLLKYSIIFLALSGLLAFRLVLPRAVQFSGVRSDLVTYYERHVSYERKVVGMWAIAWVIGLGLGMGALYR